MRERPIPAFAVHESSGMFIGRMTREEIVERLNSGSLSTSCFVITRGERRIAIERFLQKSSRTGLADSKLDGHALGAWTAILGSTFFAGGPWLLLAVVLNPGRIVFGSGALLKPDEAQFLLWFNAIGCLGLFIGAQYCVYKLLVSRDIAALIHALLIGALSLMVLVTALMHLHSDFSLFGCSPPYRFKQ